MNIIIRRPGMPDIPWPLRPGHTLLDHLREAGLAAAVHTPCGGKGTCKKCAVRVDGAERLACLHIPAGSCTVELPETKTQFICTGGQRLRYKVDPPAARGIGIAVDIGTTSVVLYAYDLATGALIGTAAEANQQGAYGADVVSRMQAAEEGSAAKLAETIQNQLNRLAKRVISDAPAAWSVAGNTVMQHFLCGLDTSGIARAPFTPASYFGDEVPAAGLRLWAAPDAKAYLPPAISGYVGGDITAAALSCSLTAQKHPALLLDIGTNGEVALYDPAAGLSCCATAAGPAFEGALLSCGMTALPGAVDRVWLEDKQPRFTTIGGEPPAGFCGSGLVDALAVLLKLELVDETGYMEDDFVLAEGVKITPQDVRQIQLAKAAVAGGVQTLLARAGLTAHDIRTLFLAGGFGNYLRPQSAVDIGLFPAELLSKAKPIGNAAGAGAIAALLSKSARRQLGKLQKQARYHELSGDAVFMEKYMECMMFL
jgi:uncharacterized 2Fe-2S/4Fe-4S cluster protein (DUF4445 family)